jgi:hypothetical protein
MSMCSADPRCWGLRLFLRLTLPNPRAGPVVEICGFPQEEPQTSTPEVCATRLDPDARKAFRSERAVNDALRLVIELHKVGSYKQA